MYDFIAVVNEYCIIVYPLECFKAKLQTNSQPMTWLPYRFQYLYSQKDGKGSLGMIRPFLQHYLLSSDRQCHKKGDASLRGVWMHIT